MPFTAEQRAATVDAVRQAKADPRGLKITAGQRAHIMGGWAERNEKARRRPWWRRIFRRDIT